jgi:hypothetical protein
MKTLVFLLEEPSARELLKGVVPRLVPTDVHVEYLAFQGKQDLERNIPKKISAWKRPNSVFVVIRDQDSAPDCKTVKKKLTDLVNQSGKPALVRVACRTLEAWVAGDLSAVAQAFGAPNLVSNQNKQKFRDPDALGSPYEELRRLVPTYQKIDGAQRVGALLSLDSNASTSFGFLCRGIRDLFTAEQA